MRANKTDDQRVVITGMGVISPLSYQLQNYYEDLMQGRSAICYKQNQWIGSDFTNFDLKSYLHSNHSFSAAHSQLALDLLRQTPLPGQLACSVSLQAYYDAGLNTIHYPPERFGCVLAGHNFNNDYGYKNLMIHRDTEPDYIEPLFGLIFLDTDILAINTELFGLLGPGVCVGNSFASSHTAILTGAQLINADRADRVLVISVPQEINSHIMKNHAAKDWLVSDDFHFHPDSASRPFDARRKGLVPGQGAAAFILENLNLAKKRNAKIYGELLGGSVAMSSHQGFYPTINDEVKTMQQALKQANITPHEVDYINAHADSTLQGDAIEISAIKQVFGNHAYAIPINSTKSMLGHCLVAAGAMECAATLLQMQNNTLHPTINQEESDPQLDLNFVPNVGIDHPIRIALSNSFGMGGFASSIVLAKI